MDKQEMIDIMYHGSSEKKMEYLNYLNIAFDSYNRNINNSDEIVNALIDLAMTSQEEAITDEILEVICSAQVSQNLRDVNYRKITSHLSDAPLKFLPKYIEILGNSHNKEFAGYIMEFQFHINEAVQQAAKDALMELGIAE